MSLPAGGLLQFRESSGTLGGSFESLIMPSRVVSRWWLGAMPIIRRKFDAGFKKKSAEDVLFIV